jgi:malate synthase
VHLASGPQITGGLVRQIITEELAAIRAATGAAFDAARYDEAVDLFTDVALADDYVEFLTLPAYEHMP